MPIIFSCAPGEGVRIDRTELVMIKSLTPDGGGAEVVLPDGTLTMLSGTKRIRLGPGLEIGVMPGKQPGMIGLLIASYTPVMFRHPPRDYRQHLPKPKA